MIYPNLTPGLFKYPLRDSGLNLQQANELLEFGLLSFDPKKKVEFENYEILELEFLKSIYFDSYLEIKYLKKMLAGLEKPYAYSLRDIYWDFSQQKWENLPQDNLKYVEENLRTIIEENFEEFLSDTDEEDFEILKSFKRVIDEKLNVGAI